MVAAVATGQTPPASPANAPEQSGAASANSFFSLSGYLPRGAMPDSLVLNPAAPSTGSAAQARDDEAASAALALRETTRWQMAIQDNNLFSPGAALSCAAGITISPATTPKLNMLLLRVARDLVESTRPTKEHFSRPRPFMVNGQATCTPELESRLRGNGSYPSGHSAIGFGWGLVLAQAIPDRAAEIVARGRAIGDSRRICNVHWLSDVEEGRVVAAAVVARINAEPAFEADLAEARVEAAALAGKAAPTDCATEAAALALTK